MICMFNYVIHSITINSRNMQIIAFRADKEFKTQLQYVAKKKGINLSALIKLYLNEAVKEDLVKIKKI